MQSSKKEPYLVRVPVGSLTLKEPPTDDVERFLAMLRFDSKGKLEELGSGLSTLGTKMQEK